MSRRQYLTAARLARIEAGLSARDHALLNDVKRLNIMSGQQLRRLHYGDSDSDRRLARLDLKRLSDEGLLTRLGRRVGGIRSGSEGFCYRLGPSGQRLLSKDRRRSRRPWTPNVTFLTHALAVSELYTQLRLDSNGVRLETFDAEPACWRSSYGVGGQRSLLKADAYVVTGSAQFEDHWFVELDRSTESGPKLSSKIKAYVRYWQSGREQVELDVFPRVVWIVPDKRRAQFLMQIIRGLPEDHRRLFMVVTAAEATQSLLGAADTEAA